MLRQNTGKGRRVNGAFFTNTNRTAEHLVVGARKLNDQPAGKTGQISCLIGVHRSLFLFRKTSFFFFTAVLTVKSWIRGIRQINELVCSPLRRSNGLALQGYLWATCRNGSSNLPVGLWITSLLPTYPQPRKLFDIGKYKAL